jgi:hypothetical protein
MALDNFDCEMCLLQKEKKNADVFSSDAHLQKKMLESNRTNCTNLVKARVSYKTHKEGN